MVETFSYGGVLFLLFSFLVYLLVYNSYMVIFEDVMIKSLHFIDFVKEFSNDWSSYWKLGIVYKLLIFCNKNVDIGFYFFVFTYLF